METLKYTICFLQRGEDILMLNRIKPSNMGLWNGVGGKLEAHETPQQGILREVAEETGIVLHEVHDRGMVTWGDGESWSGGMHLFYARLADDYSYATPRRSDEGLLDFKPVDWVLSPENRGIVENIRFFLPLAISDDRRYRHHCHYHRVEDFMGGRWQLDGVEATLL